MEKKEANFETVLKRLEEIVDKMEGGGQSLEESMKLYEEGMKNIETLNTMLTEARATVMKLVAENEEETTLEPFDGENLD